MLLPPESTLREIPPASTRGAAPSPPGSCCSSFSQEAIIWFRGSALAVLGHHLPANRDPTSTASGTGVGVGESTTAVQAETTGAFGICQEMLTFPGPVFWPERPALRPLHTLQGHSLPVRPSLHHPALWRLQENERREGDREGRKEREKDICARVYKHLIS